MGCFKKSNNKIPRILFIITVRVCMCAMERMWRSGDKLQESVLSWVWGGVGCQTRVTRIMGQGLLAAKLPCSPYGTPSSFLQTTSVRWQDDSRRS